MNAAVVIGILMAFSAKGEMLTGVVLGDAPSMEKCAQEMPVVVNHAYSKIPQNQGYVVKGYCADLGKNLIQEEATVGSVKSEVTPEAVK